MDTFEPPRDLVESPHFARERALAIDALASVSIEAPIEGLIRKMATLPYCFTLQSCFGHFIHSEQAQSDNLEPLPPYDIGTVRYRIAYVAICIEHSTRGRLLLDALHEIPVIAPEFIQLGSPAWFWDQRPNSYALQVEPTRFQYSDQASVDYREALHIQQVRDQFFERLREMVDDLLNNDRSASDG